MSLFTDADVPTLKKRLAAAGVDVSALTDPEILAQLRVGERDIARQLKVFLEPTTVFPYEPSAAEIEALDGKPYAVEPGYDYDVDFFRSDSWGYLVLNNRPLISVSGIRFAYPSPLDQFWEIPDEWIRIDKHAGTVRLVPATQTMTAPLSVFMMQAMGGGRGVPYMIQVNYVAGLKDAKADWPDLVDVIYKSAVLSAIEGEWRPGSGSISADGLSESASYDPEKMRGVIDAKLFGPKGANGGLWSAIHGIGVGMLGATN